MTETSTLTLADFLLARIAEDERDAAQLDHDLGRWERESRLNGPDGTQGSILAAELRGSAADPARVLAECDAKRRIVGMCADDRDDDFVARFTLRLLALPYADHPDYRPEWRP